jgi:hypothetical protein
MAIIRKSITVAPVGADGSAVATATILAGQAGFVRAIAIDYQNQPTTTDILIKDSTTSGATLFTRTSSNTDLALTPVAMPGIDEAGAATAATDVGSGGWPFLRGLFIDVAQGDGQTSGNEKIVFTFLIER